MPYKRPDELPSSVRDAIPSDKGKRMFMNVVNSQLEAGKSESVAFASAWAALSRAGYKKNDAGQYIGKRQLNDDVYTLEQEAMARSVDLGFGGKIHVHQTADGQKVYMPGESHEAYLEGTQHESEEEYSETETEEVDNDSKNMLGVAVRAIIEAIMGKPKEHADIVKLDEEQRIVYGWASVVTEKGQTVTDRQGDVISPDDMEKMATDFMMSARMAKAMHEGEGIGEVIHSMPMTKAIANSFGVKSDREGWMIAMKVHDDEVWKRVKSGELKAFSIGGKAVKENYDA